MYNWGGKTSPSGQSTNNLRGPALPFTRTSSYLRPCSVSGLKCQLNLLKQGWGHTPENHSVSLNRKHLLYGLVERTAVTRHSDAIFPNQPGKLQSGGAARVARLLGCVTLLKLGSCQLQHSILLMDTIKNFVTVGGVDCWLVTAKIPRPKEKRGWQTSTLYSI